jgi:hypothetical protein
LFGITPPLIFLSPEFVDILQRPLRYKKGIYCWKGLKELALIDFGALFRNLTDCRLHQPSEIIYANSVKSQLSTNTIAFQGPWEIVPKIVKAHGCFLETETEVHLQPPGSLLNITTK